MLGVRRKAGGHGRQIDRSYPIDLHLVCLKKVPEIEWAKPSGVSRPFGSPIANGAFGRCSVGAWGHCRDDRFSRKPALHRGRFLEHGAVAIELRAAGLGYL